MGPILTFTYMYLTLGDPEIYTSLTSKNSIFVGVRVDQRVFFFSTSTRWIQVSTSVLHTATHTSRTMGIWFIVFFLFSFFVIAVSVI